MKKIVTFLLICLVLPIRALAMQHPEEGEIQNYIMYIIKDFENPEVMERYIISKGNTTKVFAAVKNIKSENTVPLLGIGVFDTNNNQLDFVANAAPSTDLNSISPLSIQYSGDLSGKVYIFDDAITIKPLYYGGVIWPAD